MIYNSHGYFDSLTTGRSNGLSLQYLEVFRKYSGNLLHFYAFFVTVLCMRTTIEITDELLRRAKEKAASGRLEL